MRNISLAQMILEEQVIARLSVSEATNFNHILTELTLGDGAPSQLGGDKLDTELLQSLWLHRLPESTQIILALLRE